MMGISTRWNAYREAVSATESTARLNPANSPRSYLAEIYSVGQVGNRRYRFYEGFTIWWITGMVPRKYLRAFVPERE